MKAILVFCFIFLVQVLTRAQSITPGLYVNKESNEFICFHKDSVQFRIYNNDAFGTFSIGKGKYGVQKRGKYHILPSNAVMEQTSVINRIPRNDSLIVIKVLDCASTPIMSANVYINDLPEVRKGSMPANVSDQDGQITLSESQANNFTNKKLSVQIEALGFCTKKMVVLKRGYDYVIQSVMPESYPFTVFKTGKILIKSLNDKEIEVEILKSPKLKKLYRKTILKRVSADIRWSHIAFNKDVVTFDEN